MFVIRVRELAARYFDKFGEIHCHSVTLGDGIEGSICEHGSLMMDEYDEIRLQSENQACKADKFGFCIVVGRSHLPLVTLFSWSLPIVVLLFRGHGIPFLGLRLVPPQIVKVCIRVLYKLRTI